MDVVRIGPRNIKDQVFTYKRGKTRIDGTIGIPPALLASIAACPLVGTDTYLVNAYGDPFTDGGFGNRFKKWCREAGVPENCSLHGIRKAAAVRAAENGATTHQLMAMFAWATVKQAEHYTKRAERRKLGLKGAQFLQKQT